MEQIWKTKETIWENAAEQKERLMKVPVEGVVGENGHRRGLGHSRVFLL